MPLPFNVDALPNHVDIRLLQNENINLSAPKRMLPKVAKSNKSVRFTSKAKVHYTLALCDMTLSERNGYWYNQQQLDQMKKSIRCVVKQMMMGIDTSDVDEECSENDDDSFVLDCYDHESDDFCTRGLESKTRDGSWRRAMNKVESISAVMDEQISQEMEGIHDPERIADVYIENSAHCAKAAYNIGLQDQKAVAKCLLAIPELHCAESNVDISAVKELSQKLELPKKDIPRIVHKAQNQQQRSRGCQLLLGASNDRQLRSRLSLSIY